MKEQTVKRKIFRTNALMIIVALGCILLINIGVVKIYWENIERNWQASMEVLSDSMNVENMLKEWTIHQRSFYMLLLADVLVCIAVWVMVSLFFTGRLVQYIMKPLEALENGAKRIRENILTEQIAYRGDMEFEGICDTFNDMQAHILGEQEKNRKYEQARTEMIAGISHDLRTPLTAIKGTIKGMLDGVVKDETQQEKFLQIAYRRTEEMDMLLNQLFYISKLQTGNMPLDLQPTDLVSYIWHYAKNKSKVIDGDRIQLSVECTQESIVAEIDREQLQRIFDNLFENSQKYAQAEPVKIVIGVERRNKDCLIRFADNGTGVPEEKLGLLFDEFYRVDESRSRRDGNGLGLYIVKKLTEAMHGNVSAGNRNGLVIEFTFPVIEEAGIVAGSEA